MLKQNAHDLVNTSPPCGTWAPRWKKLNGTYLRSQLMRRSERHLHCCWRDMSHVWRVKTARATCNSFFWWMAGDQEAIGAVIDASKLKNVVVLRLFHFENLWNFNVKLFKFGGLFFFKKNFFGWKSGPFDELWLLSFICILGGEMFIALKHYIRCGC